MWAGARGGESWSPLPWVRCATGGSTARYRWLSGWRARRRCAICCARTPRGCARQSTLAIAPRRARSRKDPSPSSPSSSSTRATRRRARRAPRACPTARGRSTWAATTGDYTPSTWEATPSPSTCCRCLPSRRRGLFPSPSRSQRRTNSLRAGFGAARYATQPVRPRTRPSSGCGRWRAVGWWARASCARSWASGCARWGRTRRQPRRRTRTP
mmetsp:Transcript_14428/g.36579  ORF Transcript_14428/g.36579 Transcript_14428/m.36579 type:complete len:213 (-) Transcript_14428:150-788(-)